MVFVQVVHLNPHRKILSQSPAWLDQVQQGVQVEASLCLLQTSWAHVEQETDEQQHTWPVHLGAQVESPGGEGWQALSVTSMV
jgi:hypothetical protein